ncbi:MAG: DUF1285 domain-containing protein [Alphaproteobacteria bacterium]|nr:DUF1285 domain-containing protein [Alphaproteobacteria bacterium]
MQEEENTGDFRIAQDGTWFHDGDEIKREALARLFATRALKVDENGDYWLATPYEKYPVEVEDVPFVIVNYEQEGDDVVLKTNMDEQVKVSPSHPLELRNNIPYIDVRDGLYARLGRSVLYNLIEEYGAELKSGGKTYKLGEL